LSRGVVHAREGAAALPFSPGYSRPSTADERTTGLAAALRDTGNDGARRLDLELPGREVVEEEQRLCSLRQEVVHAHSHEVDADAGMPTGVDGDIELGADAVVASATGRVAEAGRQRVE